MTQILKRTENAIEVANELIEKGYSSYEKDSFISIEEEPILLIFPDKKKFFIIGQTFLDDAELLLKNLDITIQTEQIDVDEINVNQ